MPSGSAKISGRSALLLFGCGCRCLALWFLLGLRWRIRAARMD